MSQEIMAMNEDRQKMGCLHSAGKKNIEAAIKNVVSVVTFSLFRFSKPFHPKTMPLILCFISLLE